MAAATGARRLAPHGGRSLTGIGLADAPCTRYRARRGRPAGRHRAAAGDACPGRRRMARDRRSTGRCGRARHRAGLDGSLVAGTGQGVVVADRDGETMDAVLVPSSPHHRMFSLLVRGDGSLLAPYDGVWI